MPFAKAASPEQSAPRGAGDYRQRAPLRRRAEMEGASALGFQLGVVA